MYLFCLTNFDCKLAPQDFVFKKEPFQVQLHKLPLGMMNRRFGESLEEIISEVEDVDVGEDGVGWGPYLRVRVWLDIT